MPASGSRIDREVAMREAYAPSEFFDFDISSFPYTQRMRSVVRDLCRWSVSHFAVRIYVVVSGPLRNNIFVHLVL
jgi:hypothetical protein